MSGIFERVFKALVCHCEEPLTYLWGRRSNLLQTVFPGERHALRACDDMKMSGTFWSAARFCILSFFFFCIACDGHNKPTYEYMPNMMDSRSVKAQEAPMRTPVAGTIPQGFAPYPYKLGEGSIAAVNLKNPFPKTKENLLKGQKAFSTYCIVCHGERGLGDGTIVPKFPRPPSLTSEKIMQWADGEIFHTMMVGQNLMPSYATQMSPQDRWAIVNYIRVLQRANNPREEDLKKLNEELEGPK